MAVTALDVELSLRVAAGDAQSGCKVPVKYTRFVQCTKCSASYRSAAGCPECDSGLTTREEQLTVTVPAGTMPGAILRIASKGHESTREPTGDVYLKVVVIQPTAANADDNTKSSRPRARAHHAGTAWIVAVALVLLVAPFAWLHIHERLLSDFGAHCVNAEDCRSNKCLIEYDGPADNGAGPVSTLHISRNRVDAMCTKFCVRDSDCPSTTRCGKAASSTYQGFLDHLPDNVCVKAAQDRVRVAP
jgi:DnaJ C terminal domain